MSWPSCQDGRNTTLLFIAERRLGDERISFARRRRFIARQRFGVYTGDCCPSFTLLQLRLIRAHPTTVWWCGTSIFLAVWRSGDNTAAWFAHYLVPARNSTVFGHGLLCFIRCLLPWQHYEKRFKPSKLLGHAMPLWSSYYICQVAAPGSVRFVAYCTTYLYLHLHLCWYYDTTLVCDTCLV